MTNPNVREIGRMADIDGVPIIIGQDYGAVTIHRGTFTPGGGIRLDTAGFEEFSQLAIAARHQADRCPADEAIEEAAS